jgi:hypothetical protein
MMESKSIEGLIVVVGMPHRHVLCLHSEMIAKAAVMLLSVIKAK